MISVRLQGNLGNQLFQMSACIALSLKHSIPYYIPPNTLDNQKWKPYHFDNIRYCNDDGVRTMTVYKEPSFTYSEIPKPSSRYFLLDGFFQSEKYFVGYRKEIIEAFGFSNLESKTECTAIHVRRGDYLKYPTIHPVVTIEYLIEAMRISEEKGFAHFACFSDDMNWVKGNINTTKFPNYTFEYFEGNSDITDLKLMIGCKNIITSNSTFSWWGAYINNNPEKFIIMPSNWFGENMKHDTKDLYISGAIII